MKIKSHTCDKCGKEIQVPDYHETRPLSEYFRKWERAILKHGWQHHREDFPTELRSFTQLMKWLGTPEGKEWNQKQDLTAEAERAVRQQTEESED